MILLLLVMKRELGEKNKKNIKNSLESVGKGSLIIN